MPTLPKAVKAWECTADPEGNGAQGYRPMLSTGQAGMPTLPKARIPALPECRFGMFGSFGSLGMFGSFGILGRILLLPEFARGTIGPEGVCEAYGEEGREEKAFFAKQTHFKTSDIQLTNCI